MRQYYRTALRRLGELSDERETIAFDGHTIEILRSPAPASAASSGAHELDQASEALNDLFDARLTGDNLPEELALCLTDDRFMLATSRAELERIVRRADTGSLAQDPDYRRAADALGDAGPVRCYLSIPRVLAGALREADDAAETEHVRRWQNRVGPGRVPGPGDRRPAGRRCRVRRRSGPGD